MKENLISCGFGRYIDITGHTYDERQVDGMNKEASEITEVSTNRASAEQRFIEKISKDESFKQELLKKHFK